MDAVILAAGINARLRNYVPEFHKPLLPLTSQLSLLRNAVQLAIAQGVKRPVVVASPSNAHALDQDLVGLPVDMVIQRMPIGPGDALRLGLALRVQRSERVLVLLSDNTLTHEDVSLVCVAGGIGTRPMDRDDAQRFTWYDPTEQRWHEKELIPDKLQIVDCWVGPFVGYRNTMEVVLNNVSPINGEYLIGPHLGNLTSNGPSVYVSSRDVGTEEAYLDYLRERR